MAFEWDCGPQQVDGSGGGVVVMGGVVTVNIVHHDHDDGHEEMDSLSAAFPPPPPKHNSGPSSLPGLIDLRTELMRMFDEDLKPRLRRVATKPRAFFYSSALNGKVLYESHCSEVEGCAGGIPDSPTSSSPPPTIEPNFNIKIGASRRPGYRQFMNASILKENRRAVRAALAEVNGQKNNKNSSNNNKNNNYRSSFSPPPLLSPLSPLTSEEDVFLDVPCWSFHLREHDGSNSNGCPNSGQESLPPPAFAGCKVLAGSEAAIRSKAGTVRGVTNRVRAGIATFLHTQNHQKHSQQEAGRVVVYVSTLGIIRETFQQCLAVRSILRTLLIHFEERDVFRSRSVQAELRERMGGADHDVVVVPQVFIEGKLLGNADTIEQLNETGRLRQILRPYKRANSFEVCQMCGGYRLLPCGVCKGSKKSVHRNTFTEEFLALRCMQCDESGLVRCDACADPE